METATKTTNEQFYERTIANLYYTDFEECGGDVFRAKDFADAAAKTVSKDHHYELIGIHKLDLRKDFIHDLYQAIGAIEMLITFEDAYNLASEIYGSRGDYQFTLDQLHEDYIRQLNSMDLLIEKLESIKEAWSLRKNAVELFREELKDLKIEDKLN